ncbi:MAG TPA: glutamate--cysteine ligase [Burkholderiales bacterium]|nr:glutamate--cysteine ligase [Burkholderiales bacterium]
MEIRERLRALPAGALTALRRGIEKESLRVQADGSLALTPHPASLGSPLTHPHITTDFSESQLELITGVHADADACLQELTEIHQVVMRAIAGELLWASSMPCDLPADDAIPIGRYGTSNVGRAKSVYRMGLSYRYGRRMQTISGIHYNFSLPGVGNDGYFALMRNFRRLSWLPLYLFGASPAVCTSFVEGRAHALKELAPGTLYLPYATSLRMGRLGYQSEAQAKLAVSYNSLASYAASLQEALTVPYPPYERIGVRDKDSYRQLSTSLLQIENEFYSPIRPKRRIKPGERPLHALRERGVEYVEVRLIDLDPFNPVGINAQTMRFLDILLLYCLVAESPPDNPEELAAIARNKLRGAQEGRKPGLKLERRGGQIALLDWGKEVVSACEPIAQALDDARGGAAYRDSLQAAHGALADSDAVPSARVLHAMARNHGNSHIRLTLAESLSHRGTLLGIPLKPEVEERFARLAEESVAKQKKIEASDRVDFETYRQRYLNPVLLQAEALEK